MAGYCFDSSALVKYFHAESGSTWIKQVVNQLSVEDTGANEVFIADISRVEVPAAFAILERTRQITIHMRDGMYRSFLQQLGKNFEPLRLSPRIIDLAAELTQHYPLKAYDAVQLATALDVSHVLNSSDFSVTFVTSDKTLLQAAQSEGLKTENPMNHAELD